MRARAQPAAVEVKLENESQCFNNFRKARTTLEQEEKSRIFVAKKRDQAKDNFDKAETVLAAKKEEEDQAEL